MTPEQMREYDESFFFRVEDLIENPELDNHHGYDDYDDYDFMWERENG